MTGAAVPVRQPSVAYLRQAAAQPRKLQSSESRTKLLIVDLNNCLLARKSRQKQHAKHPVPRPYLSTFLDYIARSEYKLFVWSSSRPVNVTNLCRAVGILPPENAKASNPDLVGYWTRDNLGLSEADYDRKVQVIKDLDSIFADPTLGSWSQADTVLLDDSDAKAVLQPYNHLHLPLFDPFGNADARFDDDEGRQLDSRSVVSSFVGRSADARKPAGPELRSDSVDNWRRGVATATDAVEHRPQESRQSSFSKPKQEPFVKVRSEPYRPDPAAFANFSSKRKPPPSESSAPSGRYGLRPRPPSSASSSTPLNRSASSFARSTGPTAWPFAAPGSSSAAPASRQTAGQEPVASPPPALPRPQPRSENMLSPQPGLPVGNVPVSLPPSVPSSVAASIAGDTPVTSTAATENGDPDEPEWQSDTMLLRAIAALDVLSSYADVSAAIRNGVVAGCFKGPKRAKTVEERLAALWDDRRSTATRDEDDRMSISTVTATETEKMDEWERKGREAAAKLGVEVRKEFVKPSW